MNQRLVDVRLYGHLRKFGKVFRLAVLTPAEGVRALCCILPGFRQHVADNGSYRVVVGKHPVMEDKELGYPVGPQSISIVPVVAGAAKGLGKVLVGVALIGLSFVPGMQALAWGKITAAGIAMNLGTSLVLGGISQMLTKTAAASTSTERPENLPSYIFNGPINTTGQGNPVPILYGRMRVGSQVISTGLSVAQIA